MGLIEGTHRRSGAFRPTQAPELLSQKAFRFSSLPAPTGPAPASMGFGLAATRKVSEQ
jgi:hypothetical protein